MTSMRKLEQFLINNKRQWITEGELEMLWHGTPNSRYSKVKRLLAQGQLLHLRRGLYCLPSTNNYLNTSHPYELAQYIYGPSYISLESALSFHQLIPEAVYTITSATSKRSNIFQSSLGTFTYAHFPTENLYTEVELITEKNHQFLMAKPWKAICDYLFHYKKNWTDLKAIIESLRINLELLPHLSEEESERLDEYYHLTRISRFLKQVKSEHFS